MWNGKSCINLNGFIKGRRAEISPRRPSNESHSKSPRNPVGPGPNSQKLTQLYLRPFLHHTIKHHTINVNGSEN